MMLLASSISMMDISLEDGYDDLSNWKSTAYCHTFAKPMLHVAMAAPVAAQLAKFKSCMHGMNSRYAEE